MCVFMSACMCVSQCVWLCVFLSQCVCVSGFLYASLSVCVTLSVCVCVSCVCVWFCV